MNKENLLMSGLIAAVVTVIVILVTGFATDGMNGRNGKDGQVGASPGPEHFGHQVFVANYSIGGNILATTSEGATLVLSTAELNREVSYISWTPNLAATLTTMASSAAPFNNMKVGEQFSTWLYNASTTEGVITLAAGTGVDLQEEQGGVVVIDQLESAYLTFIKKVDTNILMIAEVFQVGD